jgi:hypothetical protein
MLHTTTSGEENVRNGTVLAPIPRLTIIVPPFT